MRFRRNFSAAYSGVTTSRIVVLFACTILATPVLAAAQIEISEVMYDANGSDSKSEWIEIYNTGTSTIDISKWKVNDGSNHVLNAPPKNGSTGSLLIAPGGYVVLAADAGIFLQTHPSIVSAVIDTVLNLSNTSGTVSVLDESSTVIDRVKYSSSKGADGNGDSLQQFGTTFSAAPPTPGKENIRRTVNHVTEKKVVNTKTTETKKSSTLGTTQVAAVANAVNSQSKSVVVSNTTELPTSTVPRASNTSMFQSPWIFGALAAGVAASAVAIVARKKKEGEWEIEEITDDV